MSRTVCSVPYCKCTVASDKLLGAVDDIVGPKGSVEWLCRKHWKVIPLVHRRVHARSVSRNAGSWPASADRIWRWLKREAIERSVGLA